MALTKADEDKLRARWDKLSARMEQLHDDVEHGVMMSAPALTRAGKVFAFYSAKGGRLGLGCRLGRDYEIESLGLSDWQHLAPFRSKPPMKDWIVAGAGDADHWDRLADEALRLARGN